MDRLKLQEVLSALDSVPMGPKEREQRLAVVQEAVTWAGTPYHANADVKGAGVDCGMFLIKVYSKAGVIESFDPRPYPVQWSFNQRSERYLAYVMKYSREIEGPPLPGDVVVFQVGNTWSHSSIVTCWPSIIHSNPPECQEDNWELNFGLRARKPRFFSPWGTA